MDKILEIYYSITQIVKENLVSAFSVFIIKIYLIIALIINIISWAGAYYIAKTVGAAQIALHYSVGFGIDYYSDTEKIYTIPLLGLFIILLNFLLYTIIDDYRDRNFLAHILFSTTIAVNAILLISVCSIYIINF